MDTDKLIQFFKTKLEKIPELKEINNYDDPTFTAWWRTIQGTCERMGSSYAKKTQSVHFFPGVIVGGGDNSVAFSRAYQSGLVSAEALLNSLIEELETWGFNGVPASGDGNAKKASPSDSKVILNLTVSQQQIQEITQTINLSQYDQDVQAKVEELLAELKKPAKDKKKIVNTVKWLADKGADALIAILLASTHLTS